MLRTLATPKWIGLSVTAILLIVAFGGMSYWQWQRAQRDEVPTRDTVPSAQVLTSGSPLAEADYGAPVEVTGTYDVDAQVLIQHGTDGFWIVTPLRPASGDAVPVARGTVRNPADPAVGAAPSGIVTVRGLAQPFEGDPGTGGAADGVAPMLTGSAFSLDYALTRGWIALTAQTPAAQPPLGPVVPPFGASTTSGIRLQNAGYAVQWVVFAGFVVFVWGRFLREDSRIGQERAPLAQPSRPEIY